MSKPDLPYRFCQHIGCREMVDPGAIFCEACMRRIESSDLFFHIDDDFADASHTPENTP